MMNLIIVFTEKMVKNIEGKADWNDKERLPVVNLHSNFSTSNAKEKLTDAQFRNNDSELTYNAFESQSVIFD